MRSGREPPGSSLQVGRTVPNRRLPARRNSIRRYSSSLCFKTNRTRRPAARPAKGYLKATLLLLPCAVPSNGMPSAASRGDRRTGRVAATGSWTRSAEDRTVESADLAGPGGESCAPGTRMERDAPLRVQASTLGLEQLDLGCGQRIRPSAWKATLDALQTRGVVSGGWGIDARRSGRIRLVAGVVERWQVRGRAPLLSSSSRSARMGLWSLRDDRSRYLQQPEFRS